VIEKEKRSNVTMLRDAHPAIEGTVRGANSIHILGAGLNPERPAHQAIHDLDGKGWRLVPIHPRDAGGAILGRPIRASIDGSSVPEIVVFFLAPERAKQAVMELMVRHGQSNLPLLWFQPGSEHEEVLEMLNESGILHIVDDCIVRYIQRHHLISAHNHSPAPWYLQVASEDGSGCSVWTVEDSLATQDAPGTPLEWCGDVWDLEHSEHTVARYVRSLAQGDETLPNLALRLA
jgi:predicted CoA-binding protein